jgi:hypothetical protein
MWSHKRNETMSLTEDFAIDLAPMMKMQGGNDVTAPRKTPRGARPGSRSALTLALNRCEKIYGNVFLT